MNGLDFDHRVLRPWANNPAFYVTVFPQQSDQPAREGHYAYGGVELWSYEFPLTAERAERIGAGIRIIPKLLEQAKGNLVGDRGDLWTFGARRIRQQSAELERLATRVADAPGTLKTDVQRAKAATDAFAAWLDAQAPSKRAPSGVGVENYNWYLKNVQLVPYTWQDEVIDHGARARPGPRVPRARGAAQRGAPGPGADRDRRRLQPPLQRCGDAVHGVPRETTRS